MFAPTEQWLTTFMDAIHSTMRRCGAKRNSCIETCLVGTSVAREFAYLVEPVPVAVLVINGHEATVLPDPAGTLRRRPGFAGHLVLYFSAANVLMDLTADQFHAPRRGLLVPRPLFGYAARRLLPGGVEMTLAGGTTITYREMVGDVSWQLQPAWAEPSTLLTTLALRRLRANLHRAGASKIAQAGPHGSIPG